MPWRTALASLATAWIPALPLAAAAQVVIHELRIDQPGPDTDEYVELAGPPGTLLDDLAYIVIGDGSGAGNRGVIEAVVRLDGAVLPDSGLLVVAESSFTLGGADVVAALSFENGDPVTHLLVRGLAASLGDDLDADDDGMLDRLPFADVLDAAALLGDAPAERGSVYFLDERVGPDAGMVPFHVVRCPDAGGGLLVAAADPAAGTDTPGAPNACPAPPPEPAPRTIPEIQGASHGSPLAGASVVVTGVVTAVDRRGLYLQDRAGDGDPRTSDAVFVFTSDRPDVLAGDVLRVTGTVLELVPGGPSTRNLSITQVVDPEIERLSRGAPLPAPVRLGRQGRRLPSRVIDDDAFTVFDPEADAIDLFESLEGMRVVVPDAHAVAPTSRFGETTVVVDGGRDATGQSRRGALVVREGDFNPERVQIQIDAGVLRMPRIEVTPGARLGDVTGIVSYAFGSYEVLVSEPLPPPHERPRPLERTRVTPYPHLLSIASWNVLNLDPNDADGDRDVANGRFAAIGRAIVERLRAPDIVALQEIQDRSGTADTGETSAAETLALLVAAIDAAGGPRYAAIDHPFIGDGTSGGQPGGNIRVAYLYDPTRVELVPGSLSAVVDPAAQQVDRAHPFFRSRLPLSATFRFRGETVTLINVHLAAKSGSAPLFGTLQPSSALQEHPMLNGGVDARRAQAAVLADHVRGVLANEPGAHVAVLGDMNELAFVSPLRDVLGSPLINLMETLPERERYTFFFEGNAQALDHVFVSPSLRGGARFDIVHAGAELPEAPDRPSDHEPVLARLEPRGRRGAAVVRLLARLLERVEARARSRGM